MSHQPPALSGPAKACRLRRVFGAELWASSPSVLCLRPPKLALSFFCTASHLRRYEDGSLMPWLRNLLDSIQLEVFLEIALALSETAEAETQDVLQRLIELQVANDVRQNSSRIH